MNLFYPGQFIVIPLPKTIDSWAGTTSKLFFTSVPFVHSICWHSEISELYSDLLLSSVNYWFANNWNTMPAMPCCQLSKCFERKFCQNCLLCKCKRRSGFWRKIINFGINLTCCLQPFLAKSNSIIPSCIQDNFVSIVILQSFFLQIRLVKLNLAFMKLWKCQFTIR